MSNFDNMIDTLYNYEYPNGLTPNKQNEKDLEKKYIKYLFIISEMFEGYLNYSIPGVIFLTFPGKQLKPENKYNFYFEGNKFRCINQVNLHQEYVIYELDIDSINEETLVHDIIIHITTLKLIQTKQTQQFTNIELTEFSNPF